ncbi:Ribonuclease HII [Candidatus Bilamarchaeum dharawalense]|uniref:Ribonuclease n=1 Tax=Candidatus Bilamarchaeum dharawalense TaxID=2885759 RepID=A0A5E4LPT2_9ARCH|nr:Ribonuclease HII [Candidatus Bilamarchaeum dharawalense]
MFSYIAGLDEAGRGAVLGPLVVCIAVCKRDNEKLLRKWASKDSKALTPNQRETSYVELKKFCTFRWVEISATDLDKLMKTMSLNDIEAKVMADLIKKAEEGDVMIDMPDRYSWTFRKRMEKFGVTKFEAEHKADENYPIVAAASICAKVTRDAKIAEIKQATCDFGSGYPSDPRTIEALQDKEKKKMITPFIRTRWKTLDRIKQTKLFDSESEE